VDRHNFLMFSDLTGLPAPALPGDLVLSSFDPAHAEELRAAHNEAFRDYPNGTAVDERTWNGFMVTATHTRHAQSFVLREPRADGGRVAAYVFVHEYALAPSGSPGREAYVAYVGTLPAHRGRGLATHLLAHTLHACRDAGFDTSSLDVDTQNPTGALGIYERAGYAVRHRQDNYSLVEEPVS
jgi:ribosomal protein S18 acetylase RimI-like enzyme